MHPRLHDCRNNRTGSSKAMGPNVVYALWNAAPEQHVKFSTYVRDDGCDTEPPASKMYPMLFKNAKISLTTRLYNLSSQCKFPNRKFFSYCIAQNKSAGSLKRH